LFGWIERQFVINKTVQIEKYIGVKKGRLRVNEKAATDRAFGLPTIM
jgi:hypothetical protein